MRPEWEPHCMSCIKATEINTVINITARFQFVNDIWL